MNRSNTLITLGITAAIAAVIWFVFRNHPFFYGGRLGGWHMGPGMIGHHGMGGFMMIFFWGIVLVGIYLLISSMTGSGRDRTASPSDRLGAVDILKQRYARGEINKTEFQTMMDELRRA